ncbi:uncharacterized protein LOC135487685 [Lineus longissimus]|uniref:uncharacterized protein LOC135487685 n=1 Tax=Lineus longissimus TaxID=88925 RepID=UPI00315C6F06
MAVCFQQPASLDFHRPKPSRKGASVVKVEDIYRWADKEQRRSTDSHKRDTLTSIHAQLLKESDIKMLASWSRPKTSVGLPTLPRPNSQSPEKMRSRSVASGVHRDRNITPFPLNCSRAESRVNEDLDDVTPLSRQCCEVLGPTACNHCMRVNKRHNQSDRCESAFPSLHVSEQHFTTALLLKRYFPGTPTYELQNRVASGHIYPSTPRKEKFMNKPSRKIKPPGKSNWASIAPDGASWTFFQGIRDLNQKIVSGRMHRRSHRYQIDSPADMQRLTEAGVLNSSDSRPVSRMVTRRLDKVEKKKPEFVLEYDPPLCTKEAQQTKNVFFAGEEQTNYDLPERLPEKLMPEEFILEVQRVIMQSPVSSRASSSMKLVDSPDRMKRRGTPTSERTMSATPEALTSKAALL